MDKRGVMRKVNWESGFKRLTLVLSILLGLLLLILTVTNQQLIPPRDIKLQTPYSISEIAFWSIGGFAAPWVAYLFIKYFIIGFIFDIVIGYIAKGFKQKETRDKEG